MREQKYWQKSGINVWNFNETLTNSIVSFEQPDPDVLYISSSGQGSKTYLLTKFVFAGSVKVALP